MLYECHENVRDVQVLNSGVLASASASVSSNMLRSCLNALNIKTVFYKLP